MLQNTASLRDALTHVTEEYVSDVSYQLTNDIYSRIEANKRALSMLGSVLSEYSGADAEQMLKKEEQVLDFDALVVINQDGTTIPEKFDIRDLEDPSGIRASFQGESSVIYVEGQNLLFSVPVVENGRIERVLAGVRRKENMQALIQPKSYAGNGLTCIVDSNGNVVISPTDTKPFLQLDSIFLSETDSKSKESVVEMKTDLENGRPGAFRFTSVDGTELVMSYQVLGVNDWFLLTMVPAGLISEEADTYLLRFFLIVGGIMCVFALFLLVMVQFYRANGKHLEEIAFTDPLTGGLNEAAFQVEYKKLAQNMLPDTYTVVFLNVKGFKLINENYGIRAGNETLKYIHQVLKEHVGPEELLARTNADHFFLCLKEREPERVQARIDEMLQAVNSFARYADIHYYLTLNQGAYCIDDPGLNITIIQDRARAACKLQKQATVCSFYNDDMMLRMKKERELIGFFEGSIQNHDFVVYLQPKVKLEDGRPGGAEALVRWFHPERGVIYPSDFIQLFEKTDHICELDRYVFEEVCKLIRRWREEGRELLPISVNLSRVHFRNLNFLRDFSALKEKYGVPDNLIEFELTESIFFDDQQRELVKSAVQEMHRHGFYCSLDDFGVGYSALALLKDVDVDTIKLDRQFFMDMDGIKARSVIEGFLSLAHRLDIKTVAEGIETKEQVDYLREADCDMVQGYVFSKPRPICEFEDWLDQQK
ncbi:bifunctional diguanylate cyclase/phosphodiesterase [Gehongia tenuis]|uniref:EAL domain-containing protein n=1 Tax=Gehongia tenuis TaxID=2763655 RepID=A0A926HKQ0_9FIRM|nr:EAL domain-containing protein [Gehongia tenuis]MBC8531227.1 EAL domain-containing protein [Gehongia tenuis]